jgi:UDP-GlcNAc:undecaprenyl-phosphate/decaprenyl-phosphate GlcNAc-1-phosphate transferase
MTIFEVFSVVAISLGFSVSFSWLALKFFPRFGLMDRPERYGHDRAPIPYPGGVAVFFAVIASVLTFLNLSWMLGAVLLGGTLLAGVSFLDDRYGLSPFLRLAVQFIAAALLVLGGIGISTISNPFGAPLVLDAWNIPLSLDLPFLLEDLTWTFTVVADLLVIFWVVSMVNAFNWIDGVPGMSSSVAAVAALALLILSVRPDFHYLDQTLAITLSAVTLGVASGFLIFDFPKPKMLIGDTGSMLLGFLLAVTAIVSGGKIATTILVLGFPILDFAWVIGRRVVKGQSPFHGDLWHFHHRLLKAGFSERKVVVFFALTAAVFGGLALLLHTEGKAVAFSAILAMMVLLAMVLYMKK